MPKFNPPDELNFQRPAWQEWKERFARYRIATKLNKEEGVVQVSTLIYTMGKEAENIFKSFRFDTEEEKDDFDAVLKKYNDHFVPKINVIFERSKFHKREQHSHELVEEFVRSLYELAEHCNFQDKNTQIRDRLVIGLRDRGLCERLQLKEDLTLEKAIEIARTNELIKEQNSEDLPKRVEAMSFQHNKQRKHQIPNGQSYSTKSNRGAGRGRGASSTHNHRKTYQTYPNCPRCGYHHDRSGSCPARGQMCKKCNRANHFAKMCKTKTVAENITMEEFQEYTDFVGAINKNHHDNSSWQVTLQVRNQETSFKIDTGADVTIMPRRIFQNLNLKVKLKSSDNILQTPAGRLETDGYFIEPVMYKLKTYKLRIFVVDTESNYCLLSRQASEYMNLIARINEVNVPERIFADSGKMKTDPVKIKIKDNAEPYAATSARRIPIPLMPKVKEELDRMENNGTIIQITEPTEWCAPIVVVPKAGGEKIRLCVDLTKLNKAVRREKFQLPTMDDIAHKLAGSKYFSTLDCASGFWQIPLDATSAKLTTFITPFGRYFFKVLPYGITSASEIFQRKMKEILSQCEGTDCFIDDIIIFGKTREEHDERLNRVLKTIEASGLKLNRQKCEFAKEELKFLGFSINKDGMKPDDERIKSITELDEPQNVTELKRILGMVNFLARHMKNISTILKPLNDLLRKDTAWLWETPQKEAFETVKKMITNAPILAFYDPSKETVVTADSSSYGIGGAILQKHGEIMRPVAYCSRTLTQAEKGYAQIEKETLAAVWTCEKLSRFLVGLPSFTLETDHKPIVPLINSKDIDQTPLRCQRLLMRLMRFNAKAEYKPGKDLHLADALSRKPLDVEDQLLEKDVKAFVNQIEASQWDANLEEIRQVTEEDTELKQLTTLINEGWPKHKQNVPLLTKKYFDERSALSTLNGIIVKERRILIPSVMRREVLDLIHDGHQGITKCRQRASQSVWWPGINRDIEETVQNCRKCEEMQPAQRKEPLRPTEMPDRPWQKAAADLFFYKNKPFIVFIDYYSRYIEIGNLADQTSMTTIGKLKSFFARHGIPETIVTDNGPQFSSREFQSFAASWKFQHETTSPHYPQANGMAERAVQTAKRILKQSDPLTALLAYRTTVHSATRFSPSALCMGRELRTRIPTLCHNLQPTLVDHHKAIQNDNASKVNDKKYFDRRHGARELPDISRSSPVLIRLDNDKQWTSPGQVISDDNPNRSYLVTTGTNTLRRNRRHIRPTKHDRPLTTIHPQEWDSDCPTTPTNTTSSQEGDDEPRQFPTTTPSPPTYVTRHGRRIIRPARYCE